jgi:hypothetical protein
LLEVFTLLSHFVRNILSYKKFDSYIYCCVNCFIDVRIYYV